MKFRFCSFLCLALLLASLPGAAAFGATLGENWEWRNPLPQGNSLYGVASGNGLLVAVGDTGTTLTSENGEDWTTHALDTNEQLTGIAWNDGEFIAVGTNGTIFTSPDGASWTSQDAGVSTDLWAVTGGASGFLAVGSNGTVLSSPDGVAWTLRSSGVTADLKAVHFANGLFAAVGESGTLVTSSDGEAWSVQDSGIPNHLEGITFNSESQLWVAVGAAGGLVTSPDATTWTTPVQATAQHLWDVVYFNGQFVGVGNLGITVQSSDGESWAQLTSGVNTTLRSAAVLDDTLVAVGQNGSLIMTTDADTWMEVSSGHSAWLLNVAYDADTFVAVGTVGRLYTSPDGLDWTQQSSLTSNALWGIVRSESRFVVVGNNGTIRYSDDAETWTSTPSGTSHHFSEVAYGAGAFVAVGRQGTVVRSPDGLNWQGIDVEGVTDWLEGIIYANNRFVAVGRNGRIITSADGTAPWTTPTSGVGENLNSVAYGAGRYVAVGQNGTILSSEDGDTWVAESSETTLALNNVVFGNNQFAVVGHGGIILTSPDGQAWTQQQSGTLTDLWGIGSAPNVFVATGDAGVVLRSTDTQDVDGLLYADWTVQMGIPSGSRGVDDDPAGDDVPNLVKFALGLDPLSSERDALPELEIVDNGGEESLALVMTQATDIHGAVLSLEVSTNLVDWEPTSHTLEPIETLSENLRRIRLVEDATFQEGDRRFLRLRVELDETPPDDPTPDADTFDGWVAAHELPANLSGPNDDPAGDGVPNLMKYAMEIDPRVYTSASDLTTQTEMIVENEAHMALVFARSTTATGVEFVLQGSDDLSTWTDLDAVLTVIGDLDGDREEVSLTDTEPKTSSRRFLRLVVRETEESVSDPEGFEGWADSHTLPENLSGPNDDPAGDNVANLMKYAMNIDPWVYTWGNDLTTQTEVMVDNEPHMQLVFARSTTATGVEFVLQGSDDLSTWTDLDADLTVIGDLDGDREEVSLTDTEPKTSSRRFIRLIVREVN